MFYSAIENTFLDPDLKDAYESAGTWPEDAKEVEPDTFTEFALSDAPPGKHRMPGSEGLPIWEDIPPPSNEELEEQERHWRDKELARTDKFVVPDYPSSESQKTEVTAYRQKLRDYPQQEGFPNIERPVCPEWTVN